MAEYPGLRRRKRDRWVARRNLHRPPRGVLGVFGADRETVMLVVLGFFFLVVLIGMAIVFLGPLVAK